VAALAEAGPLMGAAPATVENALKAPTVAKTVRKYFMYRLLVFKMTTTLHSCFAQTTGTCKISNQRPLFTEIGFAPADIS
jgi:hypothetical protein